MSDTTPQPNRHPITIRLSDTERQKVAALADAWGVTLAGAIRRLIREAKVKT